MSHNIELEGGKAKRLLTKGKYCDRDIIVSPENLDERLAQQDVLIEQIKTALQGKTAGGGDGDTFKSYLLGTLEEIDYDELVKIGQYTFYANAGLKRVILKNVSDIGQYNFFACTALEYLDLPNVETIDSYFCSKSTALTSIILPNAVSIGSYSFQNTNIEFIDFPKVASIGNYTFRYCTKITALILRKTDAISSLGGTAALAGSSIANGKGYIYVPAALIDEYKGATNWSKFAAQFRAIEDYHEITGG